MTVTAVSEYARIAERTFSKLEDAGRKLAGRHILDSASLQEIRAELERVDLQLARLPELVPDSDDPAVTAQMASLAVAIQSMHDLCQAMADEREKATKQTEPLPDAKLKELVQAFETQKTTAFMHLRALKNASSLI